MAVPIKSESVGHVVPPQNLQIDKDNRNIPQALAYLLDKVRELAFAINGKLSFGSGNQGAEVGNFDAQWHQVYFPAADTDVAIQHGLKRAPVDVDFGVPDKYTRFRTVNRGSWSTTVIYLQSETAGVSVRLRVY